MNLQFVYFDYTMNGKCAGYRGVGECKLCFSTEFDYTVIRRDGQYYVSVSKKTINMQIPQGFWKDNIYNITAIVGDNGSGKSTLLYEMILALIDGKRPSVPFVLVLRNTNADNFIVYHGNGHFKFIGELLDAHLSEVYPKQLSKSKCMLIDNTLTLGSLALDLLNNTHKNERDNRVVSETYLKDHLNQLFNKSLTASMRTAYETSYYGQKPPKLSINDQIGIFLRYESFQEIRFLFSGAQFKKLKKMKESGIPVPLPLKVSIGISDPLVRLNYLNSRMEEAYYVESIYGHMDFLGMLYANIVINCFPNAPSLWTIANSDAPSARKSIQNANIQPSQKAKYTSLIDLIYDNENLIREMFVKAEGVESAGRNEIILDVAGYFQDNFSNSKKSGRETVYQINVQDTINDEKRLSFFTEFLDKYRAICGQHYFLTFSSGLSSGEQNLLRMLTQFRYLIEGPAYEGDNDRKEGVFNSFFDGSKEDQLQKCDTLFLFLDEADLTYHPEWQRRFISILNEVLPEMFNKHIKDIQIILTTHSPLMLGDLPEASAIFLNRAANGLFQSDSSMRMSTFGMDLYSILKDGFFMNDAIGEFAKQTINRIMINCEVVMEDCTAAWSNLGKEYLTAYTNVKKCIANHKPNKQNKTVASINRAKNDYQEKYLKYATCLKMEREQRKGRLWFLIERALHELYNRHSELLFTDLPFDEWVNTIDTEAYEELCKALIEQENKNIAKHRNEISQYRKIASLLSGGLIRGRLLSEIEKCAEITRSDEYNCYSEGGGANC